MARDVAGVPLLPISLLIIGSYLTWFGVHYWRSDPTWPSDPIKAVLTGQGLPAAQPDQALRDGLTSTLAGGAAGAAGAGVQAAATAAGWDGVRCSSYSPTSTASGKGVNGASTIASPYLPLGTQVEVAFNGRQAAGTVWDFGPADWVLRSDPTRFLDLAEPMMRQLTGQASNLITAQYRVTSYGTGSVYRPNHPMTAQLRKRWTGA
jgi:hypothetical protein